MKKLFAVLVLCCTGVLAAMAADLPFKTTTISGGQFAAGTEWYVIQLGDYYLYVDNGAVKCASSADEDDDAYLWCFVGTGKKFHLYNKKKGTSGALGHQGTFEANTSNSCTFTSSGNSLYYKEGRGIYAKDLIFLQYLTTDGGTLRFLMDATKGTTPTIKSVAEMKKYMEECREAAERVKRKIDAERAAKLDEEADPIPFQLSKLKETGDGFEAGVTYYILSEGNKYFYASPERVTYSTYFSLSVPDLDKYLWAFVPSGKNDRSFRIYNKKAIESGGDYAYVDEYYMSGGKLKVMDFEQFRRYNSLTEFPGLTFKKFDAAEKKSADAAAAKADAASAAAKQAEYKAMIAKVGQSNYNMLFNNQMPKGVTLAQLNAYAAYIHKYYESTDHDIQLRQINSSTWSVTLAKTNGAAKYEDRYTSFDTYRIFLANGRVANYIVVR